MTSVLALRMLILTLVHEMVYFCYSHSVVSWNFCWTASVPHRGASFQKAVLLHSQYHRVTQHSESKNCVRYFPLKVKIVCAIFRRLVVTKKAIENWFTKTACCQLSWVWENWHFCLERFRTVGWSPKPVYRFEVEWFRLHFFRKSQVNRSERRFNGFRSLFAIPSWRKWNMGSS